MWPWRRKRKSGDEEFQRELRAHLDLEAEERETEGMSTEEARYAALRAFGNPTLVKQEMRDMGTILSLEQLMQDVRHAIRGARKAPGFTAVAVLSLTLGIGAATAVFSVMNAVAFQPLPVQEPERLVILKPELRGKRFVLFNPLLEELRDSQRSLTGIFAVNDQPAFKAAFEGQAPAFVPATQVSGNYFEVLGVTPALGRLLTSADDEPAAQSCAVVASHRYWMANYRGRPDVLGQKLITGDKVCTIVGVAPAGFRGHRPEFAPDFWLPLRPLTDPKLLASRGMAFFSGVMGRLRPGVAVSEAEAELTTLYQRMQPEKAPSPHPGQAPTTQADFRLLLASGASGMDTVRQQLGQPLTLALAVTGIVLLIAAVNVATLLLARGTARSTELATRAALGAGRIRLVRMLAVEGAVLAVGGGVLGFLIAWAATPALAKAVSIPDGLAIQPDIRVLAVAVAATLFAALIAGIVPALRLSGSNMQSGMAGATRSTQQRSGQRLIRGLVAGQLALSLLLVTSAGLLLRSMLLVMAVDPGFNTSQVVMMDVRDTSPAARFGEVDNAEDKARRAALYRGLDERLNRLPGVQAAAISWLGLFGGNYVGVNTYDVEYPENRRFTLVDYVSPRYLETVGMRLVRGRDFLDGDREGSLRVALVNEAFVRERIGAKEAIGRRVILTYADDGRPFTIVGIVADAKYNDLREKKAEAMMWVPLAQVPVKLSSVSFRVQAGTDTAVIRGVEAALKATSPHLMVRKTTTLRARVEQATTKERILLRLSSSFGAMAVLLAAVGVYGTLAYAVTRRTREIGVRLALGAQRDSVIALVLRESLLVTAGAILVGVPLSLFAGRFVQTFLYGITAWDVPTLAGAACLLAAVALLAALSPAYRASRVDPLIALKYE